ncbi:MAG: LCP family protein [Mycobacteriaceae bacterium]|uniref:LCP family protein n=1 Tax=Corynebacterium sp. TaxID=1720 RepID=UPI003F999C57
MSDSDRNPRSSGGGSRGGSHSRHGRHGHQDPQGQEARRSGQARQGSQGRHSRPSERSRDREAARASRKVAGTGAASGGTTTRNRQLGPLPVKIVLSLLAVVMLAGGGFAYGAFGNLDSNIGQAGGLDLGDQADGATDILLVGIDSRTDAQGKSLSQEEIDTLRAGEEETTSTDTIILIRVPNDGSSATAVSLPRDTYVHNDDLGDTKINQVYGSTKYLQTEERFEEAASAGEEPNEREIEKETSQAGREALIGTVADVTGISVDHYAEVGLQGFVDLTDAIGGVDVCLNNPVDEPLSGAKFPAGQQTLDGPDALSFVRQRHELPRNDLDRITRQQVFMASLSNKVLSSSTLTNPGSLGRISDAVERSVVLDDGWDVMGLATQMQNLTGGNVTFQTIPVTSIDGTSDSGESVVTIDKGQVHDFFDNLLGSEEDERDDSEEDSSDEDNGESWEDIGEYDPASSVVSVYNASEVAGLAARVGDLVAGSGYGMGEVGNAAETGISESQVNVADTDDPAARGIAKQLGGLEVVEDPNLGPGQINVTLSDTFNGPGTSESGVDEPLESIGGGDGGEGSGDDVGTPGEDATGGDGDVVGNPGTMEPEDSSTTEESIDAGGDGPMCVN